MKHYDINKDMRYLQLLAQSFPTVAEASTEIINLQAILNLPKGTEHFLADIHGEYEAFLHVLKNASGNIKRKVNELFGNTLREAEKRELCTLIYYPEQKLELVKQNEPDINDWYHITLHQLVAVCRDVSSKYTRSKVRKSLPCDFSYIIQELLHEHTEDHDKTAYVNVIVDTIISTGRADDFIIAIANVIQRLAIDQLHILGDIYDRGPGAHIILDKMRHYHSWDIQWGNHDVLWMGAAAGNDACICNVIRLSLRYANLSTLEEGYGINLIPLATFALEAYKDDECAEFMPKMSGGAAAIDEKTKRLTSQMHKAIAIIQFKIEGQLIAKHPEWKMDKRRLFEHINYEKKEIEIDGKIYPMTSCHFPTINPASPYELSPEEMVLMAKLHHSFMVCEKLHKHIKVMLQHGCMYTIINDNLLFRAVVKLFLVAGKRVVVQFAATHFFIGQIFKRYQTADVFLHPLFIRVAAFQIVIGFCRVQNTPTAGVDNHQFAWPHAAFFDHFVRLIIPDTDFRGAGNELIFGDDVARRTQTVTVEVTGGKTTVRHHDACRAIPRLHMHGVKVKEGTQFRVHIRVVLPGRWH